MKKEDNLLLIKKMFRRSPRIFIIKYTRKYTVVLEKTLESPLDCKEIQPILKEINTEYSLEGLMLKPVLWPPDVKN